MTGRLPIELTRFIASSGSRTNAEVVERAAELTGVTGSVRKPSGESNGTRAAAVTHTALAPLLRSGALRRDGDVWSIGDVNEVARILAVTR